MHHIRESLHSAIGVNVKVNLWKASGVDLKALGWKGEARPRNTVSGPLLTLLVHKECQDR